MIQMVGGNPFWGIENAAGEVEGMDNGQLPFWVVNHGFWPNQTVWDKNRSLTKQMVWSINPNWY